MRRFDLHLDLQAKITLVLLAVILPTFLIVTIAENKFTQPILEEEMKQIGITSGKTLAAQIVSARQLSLPNPAPAIENAMQDLLYNQPSITRMDVIAKDAISGALKVVASNIEDDPNNQLPITALSEGVTTELRGEDSGGDRVWDINVPIEQKRTDPRAPKRLLGNVHVVMSVKIVDRIVRTLWKTTATAAAFSVVTLLLALGYFLRKTVQNDRRLRVAETQNLQLTEQLHETERQLMITEKLAAMGQLTASFAHEIGTPLNAIGGHLQLLNEEISGRQGGSPASDRVGIISGQLAKIEEIVKLFLQNTAKPTSQKQLVDVNQLVEKTLGIVRPRMEALGVEVKRDLDRSMGPLRMVPVDLEQILLNLMNNSLDSLKAKAKRGSRLALEVTTRIERRIEGEDDGDWAEVRVYDTGAGISKADLKNVLKPFFTTKRPGEGTGLGLTICQELAHKYGGMLEIDSKEGAWARVILRVPYRV